MAFMPVIISGGAGSRLWPLSRDICPKPFVEMPEGGTLIGRAYSRAARLEGVERGDYPGEDDIVRFDDVHGRS